MKKALVWVIFLLAAVLLPADAQECTRDSFFPNAGNCGYDVSDYRLDMTWDADGDLWDVVEDITFTAEWDINELHFDFTDSYEFYGLTIDGVAVDFELQDQDLTVYYNFSHDTEYHLYAGFRGKLDYGFIFDPDGASREENDGFCMLNEPDNARRYYICNDHPKDKATYHFSFTVPASFTPAGVGRLLEIREADGTVIVPEGDFSRKAGPEGTKGTVTFTYEAAEPMAPYLFAVCAFPFDLRQKTLADGIVELDFVDNTIGEDYDLAWELAGQQEEIIRMFESYLGTYPYRDLGAIVAPTRLGAALETQTRPVYDRSSLRDHIFAHELIHQGIGDLISVEDWSDIWIKEGAASYGEDLWKLNFAGWEAYESGLIFQYEKVANGDLKNPDAEGYAGPGEITNEINEMYGQSPYAGGALVYYSLHYKLGDEVFKQAMQLLLERYAWSTVNEEKFIDAFSEAAGEDLTDLVRSWLYYGGGHVPDLPGLETYEEARAKQEVRDVRRKDAVVVRRPDSANA